MDNQQKNRSGKITVLTAPVSMGGNFRHRARNAARFGKNFLSGRGLDFETIKYGGHSAVTRSLIEGLQKIKADFNYNPTKSSEVGEAFVVLSSVEALRQAIILKKQGKIKKLLAGPNLMELPDDYGNLLADPAIDAVLVPSENIAEFYRKFNPAVANKVKVWFAGVDENYWRPDGKIKNLKKVIVYWKNARPIFNIYVERKLRQYGFEPIRIVYGKYSPRRFRKALAESKFAVFLSISETQGLALAEAWAMDVPTLVWEPKTEQYYLRGVIMSAAPYLTPQTGREWKELGELEKLLQNQSWPVLCRPRQWVLENMTDEISAKLLLSYV